MSGTYFVSPNDWLTIIFRLCLALLVGAIIGWEREIRHKPAGFRTNVLVSFGSALFVLVPLQLSAAQQSPEALSRVIQGIAAGVGFIGAGTILHDSQSQLEQVKVKGLTSAAAIWVASALGIAAGCGLWQMALFGAMLCLVVLQIFKKVEKRD